MNGIPRELDMVMKRRVAARQVDMEYAGRRDWAQYKCQAGARRRSCLQNDCSLLKPWGLDVAAQGKRPALSPAQAGAVGLYYGASTAIQIS
jgi:hypothetical protein